MTTCRGNNRAIVAIYYLSRRIIIRNQQILSQAFAVELRLSVLEVSN